MYNVERINTDFAGLVGWRESANADYAALTTALKASSTGIYFNDLPMVSMELINNMIGTDEEDVNSYLSDIYTSELNALLAKFIVFQKNRVKTKELLSNFGIGVKNTSIRRLANKSSRFVGFEIIPHKSNSIAVEILQLGTQFEETQSDLPIYFYSKSQFDPIATFTISPDKTYSLVWNDLQNTESGSGSTTTVVGAIAQYISQNYQVGDRYYVGYYEDDIEGRAVETQMPCNTCGSLPSKQYGKYVTIRPIEVRAGSTYESRELFNTEQVGYTDNTYGLHLKINVKCDITEVLVANKPMFANAFKFKVGERILNDAIASHKLNWPTSSSHERAKEFGDRWRAELEHELKTLNVDFSSIDGECLGGQRNSLSLSSL